MAAIPWWVWLGVGLFVTLTAVLAGGKVALFIWVGLVFIIVGIAKLVMVFVLKPKETKQERQVMQMPQPHGFNCPHCRLQIQRSDVFCRYCGIRLR